jgi:hypothetical protein
MWVELRDHASTAEERACVAAATRQTDRVWIALHSGKLGRPATGVPPRSAAWYRLALSQYEVLRTTGAYRHLAQVRTWACAAAEPVIAAWLNGPTDDGTVAERLGVEDQVHLINDDTQIAYLSTLLNAAQDAAVFGVPGHRVELVRTATDPEHGPAVRVLVDTPSGPAMASEPLQLAVLIDPAAAGVEAATAALRRVADITTNLFTAHADAVWHHPPPAPTAGDNPTIRTFPELRLGQDRPEPATATSAPPPSSPTDHEGRAR